MTGPRRFIARTALARWRLVLPAALLIVGHQVSEVGVPVLVGLVIDRGIAGHDPVQLAIWLAALVLLFLVLASCWRFGSLLATRAEELVHHDVRGRVVDRLLDARGFGDRPRGAGELLGIGGSDAQGVANGVQLFVYPVGQLAAVAASGVVLFGIAWPLGLAVLLGGPLFLVVLDLLGRTLRHRVEREQQAVADSATLAADAIAGFRTLSALGATRRATARYRGASDAALRSALATRRSEAGFVAISTGATGVFVIGIGLAAGALALQGAITVGQLIAVVGVVQVVMGPLEALAVNVGSVWARSSASAARVLGVLGAPVARTPREVASPDAPPSDRAGSLVLRGVSGERLRDVHLDIRPGELVGVVADAGDADELVALLGGRRHPASGAVHVDGHDLAALDAALLPSRVVVAPHTAHALPGSVLDNVTGAVVAPAVATASLSAAAFDDVLHALPDGAAARVGPSGRALSGGQRQRLALARALAAPAPVLVLHEPTTSVDAVTELAIADRLRTAVRGRTAVIISSSPQLLARTDRVVVVRGGRIAADARHDELLTSDAAYAEAVS